MAEMTKRSRNFHATILEFIEARKEAKMKGKDDPEVAAKYAYSTWISEAARLATQLQVVTHVLKATHPDAKGTSLNVDPKNLTPHAEIGSHSLGEEFANDVAGNAAAMYVSSFLQIVVEGRTLLEWMQTRDPDLQRALSNDSETAQAWMQSFAGLIREEQQPSSHPLAKQIYWLTGDEPSDDSQYLLLQPLFASSLAHAVHAEIQDSRFGEANKLARQAYRQRKAHEKPYRDYPGLVVRKLGGTKPQNISQLNSERGGMNYLLDSSPPSWIGSRTLKLFGTESAFHAFRWFDNVNHLLKSLQELLKAHPNPNLETRQRRGAIEKRLGQQLARFGAAVRGSQSPGWTRDTKCRLPLCEQLWLDSERTELAIRADEHAEDDIEFNRAFDLGDWPDEVAQRFGAWLNDRLRTAGINTVGDSELRHWASQAIIETLWPIPVQRQARGGAA